MVTGLTEDDVRTLLREAVGCDYGAVRRYATEHGLVAGLVSDVINGKRAPTPQVLLVMGLRKVVTYERVQK